MPEANINNMDLEQLALYSSMYGSQMQRESQREANITNIALSREASAFSANEALKNRQWQEHMSSTAHQRQMADLLQAGLNPILTATGGHGAGIGSGATGTASLGKVNAELDYNPLSNLSQSVYDARKMRDIEKKQLEANLAQTQSNVNLANSNMKVNDQNIETQKASILKLIQDISVAKTVEQVNSAQALKTYQDAIASGEYAKLMQSQQGYYNNLAAGVGYENFEKAVKSKVYESASKNETDKTIWSFSEWLKGWIPFLR